ncbi:MAG: hypothetical protein HRT88_08625 [Lentisphaeraceae bacterium]|nr:hypothetical protein [Lentisphaeraceae bacterium]
MKKRIIFAEDNRATMRLYQKLISRLPSWEGYFCNNFDEAAKEITSKKYDVIVSDGDIGALINGEQFLSKVSRVSPNSLRILISASMETGNSEVIHLFINKIYFAAGQFSDILKSLESDVVCHSA